ncbi:hypothetical protein IJG93_02355 [Candidatus Saccharibacteria bacterium]|nr:hypothetical protein [Candidatus Saccharibacteria bacterium]MBQ3436870.1 hypothetical protein [Candidatus Saccharibacteria bacterium]
MDNYLIDRETLGQFVDELIKRKALPVDDTAELEALREKEMKALDDKIINDIFGRLNDEQVDELNQLLDKGEESPEAFEQLFKNANIDVEQVIEQTMQDFAADFLGGEDA